MKNLFNSSWILLTALCAGCSHTASHSSLTSSESSNLFSQEKYFKNIDKLVSGGNTTQANWSLDEEWISFQHKGPGIPKSLSCDQAYIINFSNRKSFKLSNGIGRAVSPSFLPNQDRVLFSSTSAVQPTCPAEPEQKESYAWKIYPTYQIYKAKLDGSDPIPVEPGAPRAYNSEAVACHDRTLIFTSSREGNLNLYRAKLDSFNTLTETRRITQTPGYQGQAVFSPDCKKIAWAKWEPKTDKELDKFQKDLARNLFQPPYLEIWISNVDGTDEYQLTDLHSISFSPKFSPDGKRILFSSNYQKTQKDQFELFLVNTNGTSLEQITFSNGINIDPAFSPQGNYVSFSSNRVTQSKDKLDLFVAEWQNPPQPSYALTDSNPANRFLAIVQALSDPKMEGRGVGTSGLSEAENWATERFAELHLKPLSSSFSSYKDSDGFKIPVEIQTANHQKFTTNNIVGTIGNGCKNNNPIVIGAHLDHLGMGSVESLEPTQKGLHPGADDNASGIAAMLEIARLLIEDKNSNKNCYIFAAFTGEEVGIAGSSQLIELFKKLRIKPKAMLNLDMAGRLRNNNLLAFGSDSAKEWKAILDQECKSLQLTCSGGGDGYGPSDHMAFYIAGVPVLHFFTGPHLDYHRTTDTFEKINATGGIQVAKLVASVAAKVARPSQNLHFKKASSRPLMGQVLGKGKSSKGAYLGTIPDYSALTSPHGPGGSGAPGGGVKLSGTRPGSPADLAGVHAGDILKAIEGKKIQTLQDFTDVLADLNPGEKVTLEIEREGKIIKLTATPGKR